MIIGCLGGSCASREKCRNYLEGKTEDDVRLCKKNQERPTLIKEIGSLKESSQSDDSPTR